MTVVLDGGALALADVAAVARDGVRVSVGPDAARRVAAARRFVDEVAGTTAPIYGITTGFAPLRWMSVK